jgi:hypothetical protein
LSAEPNARGDTEISVPNFALLAVLELVEILESHWLDEGLRTPDGMAVDELEARSRRAVMLAERRHDREVTGLNAGLCARELHGTTMVPVPSGLVEGARALIDLLEAEARRGEPA